MTEPTYNHAWECLICGFQIGTIADETIHMFAEMDSHAAKHAERMN